MKKVKTFLDSFIDEYSGNGKVSDKTSNLLSEALSSKMARLISEQSGESDPRGYKLVFGENLHAENSYEVHTIRQIEQTSPFSDRHVARADVDLGVVYILATFEYEGKPYQFYFGFHIVAEDVELVAELLGRDPESRDFYYYLLPHFEDGDDATRLIVKGFAGVDSDDHARELTKISEKFGFPNMEKMVETWFVNAYGELNDTNTPIEEILPADAVKGIKEYIWDVIYNIPRRDVEDAMRRYQDSWY